MSNRTEIINRALVKIGANTIAAPGEESEQARKASLVFATLAQGELRRQAWSFAKKRATLAPLADTTLGGQEFGTGYNLPPDCLRLITLNGSWVFSSIREAGSGSGPEYAIEGRTLLTGTSGRYDASGAAYITYVADTTGSIGLWDANFVEAFACRLAAELVQSITKNLTLKQSLKQDYAEALREAKRTNAIELPPQSLPDDSWVLARLW
jgi:hypothetical protein